MTDVEDMMTSQAGQELIAWFQANNPFSPAFDDLDEETQAVFIRAVTQLQVLKEALEAVDRAAEESPTELHFDNDVLIAFNREFANFLDYKKELLRTPWGQQLKQKVMAVRATGAFQDLRKVWKKQCHTAAGKNLRTQFEKFMTLSLTVFVLSDKPDGFEDSTTVQTFVGMVELFDETLDGHPGQVLDWLFDDE